MSLSVFSLSHFSWAGALARPSPASAPRWGPGAGASPAPDMGRSPPAAELAAPRGWRRRAVRCWVQGTDCFSASPQLDQSPFLLLFRPGKLVRLRQRLHRARWPDGVEAAPGCPSPPPSGSARHRSGGNCGRGCSCLALRSPPPLPARSVWPLL